jgi:multiple sugar transport system ATP-binding protein
MAEVILKNVNKEYERGNLAVKDINIEIKDKEFAILVGPSGCGKTTTLRMIAGLEDITTGELFINNRKVNDIPPKDRDIAMVFQNYALYPHMSVYDNMAFGLKLRKYSKDEIRQRVNEAAKILGLEDYLDRKPKALSGGQRQRVALGRAIVRKPRVFLFDEPLSNLDAKLRVQMRTEISKLHRKLEATMIYVTHDQTEAMTMGEKIIVMKDGLVQQIDTPLNIYNSPSNKFVAGFIGSPSMNFIKGRIFNDLGIKFISNDKQLTIHLNEKQFSNLKHRVNTGVWLGVRPEDIYSNIDSTIPEDISEVEVLIDVVEPLGNEVLLYFNIDTAQCVARLQAREIPVTGTIKKLKIDRQNIHFFDLETEKSILLNL